MRDPHSTVQRMLVAVYSNVPVTRRPDLTWDVSSIADLVSGETDEEIITDAAHHVASYVARITRHDDRPKATRVIRSVADAMRKGE